MVTRIATVCAACGTEFSPCDEQAPIDGCADHGVEVIEVELLRASVLMGLVPVTAADLTTEQIEDVRAFVVDIHQSRRTEDEASLLDYCEHAIRGRDWPRERIAAAFNALRGGRPDHSLLLHRASRWSSAYRMAARLAPGIGAGRAVKEAA